LPLFYLLDLVACDCTAGAAGRNCFDRGVTAIDIASCRADPHRKSQCDVLRIGNTTFTQDRSLTIDVKRIPSVGVVARGNSPQPQLGLQERFGTMAVGNSDTCMYVCMYVWTWFTCMTLLELSFFIPNQIVILYCFVIHNHRNDTNHITNNNNNDNNTNHHNMIHNNSHTHTFNHTIIIIILSITDAIIKNTNMAVVGQLVGNGVQFSFSVNNSNPVQICLPQNGAIDQDTDSYPVKDFSKGFVFVFVFVFVVFFSIMCIRS